MQALSYPGTELDLVKEPHCTLWNCKGNGPLILILKPLTGSFGEATGSDLRCYCLFWQRILFPQEGHQKGVCACSSPAGFQSLSH